MKKVVLGSGQEDINVLLSTLIKENRMKGKKYELVDIINYKEDICQSCIENDADILFVGDYIGGTSNIFLELIKLKTKKPDIRVIFTYRDFNINDEVLLSNIASLIQVGIYDFIFEDKINPDYLIYQFNNRSTLKDVKNLLDAAPETAYKREKIPLDLNIFEEDEERDLIKNLHFINSPAPSTGKTFLTANIGIALSEMGVNTTKGKAPKILLLDTDFYGFNLGNFFGIQNNNRNLNNAIKHIDSIMNEKDEIEAPEDDVRETISLIKENIQKISSYKNLYILSGSEDSFKKSDIKKVNMNKLTFLIEYLTDEFDIVIVDSPMDILYEKRLSSIYMARKIFQVIDMNYYSVRNDRRFKDYYKKTNILDKFNYILNKYNDDEDLIFNLSELENKWGYKFVSKIPKIDDTVFSNLFYENKPVILEKDEKFLKTRLEILKTANLIWPIRKFNEIEETINSLLYETEEDTDKKLFEKIKLGLISNYKTMRDLLSFSKEENEEKEKEEKIEKMKENINKE